MTFILCVHAYIYNKGIFNIMIHIKNTKQYYGLIAIILHWLVAVGFLGAYASVYYRHWFSTGQFNIVDLNPNTLSLYLHMSFGISVAVFVGLRIIWKALNITPIDIASNHKFESIAAYMMHIILYAAMIIMPITGYMGTKLDTNFFLLFDIPKFNDTIFYSIIVENSLAMDWNVFENFMDMIHKNGGAYVVWGLIILHAGAALYHHYIRKNMVLKRMMSLPKY